MIDLSSLEMVNLPINYNLMEKSIPHFGDVNADGLQDIVLLMDFNGFTKVVLLVNKANLRF